MNGGRDLLVHGWLKLILDGSSLENSGITGSGGVIRDMWVTEFKVFSRIYIYIYIFGKNGLCRGWRG